MRKSRQEGGERMAKTRKDGVAEGITKTRKDVETEGRGKRRKMVRQKEELR
jgi:hypothetical protein